MPASRRSDLSSPERPLRSTQFFVLRMCMRNTHEHAGDRHFKDDRLKLGLPGSPSKKRKPAPSIVAIPSRYFPIIGRRQASPVITLDVKFSNYCRAADAAMEAQESGRVHIELNAAGLLVANAGVSFTRAGVDSLAARASQPQAPRAASRMQRARFPCCLERRACVGGFRRISPEHGRPELGYRAF